MNRIMNRYSTTIKEERIIYKIDSQAMRVLRNSMRIFQVINLKIMRTIQKQYRELIKIREVYQIPRYLVVSVIINKHIRMQQIRGVMYKQEFR